MAGNSVQHVGQGAIDSPGLGGRGEGGGGAGGGGEGGGLQEQPKAHLPLHRKLAYGVGHVFNDLCASMWFTYLVLFFHKVVLLGNSYAGLLILIGQVADALATPVIGFLCDRTHIRYGQRKLWHLIGTCMVALSLFFFWHTCLGCTHSALWVKIVYYSIPIIIFQFGWASVQISHLSLIPELTDDKNERVGLNAIRYAFTILSNVSVYVTMFLLLLFVHGSPASKFTSLNVWIFNSGGGGSASSNHTSTDPTGEGDISPSDVWIFSGTALGIIGAGLVFSAIFQVGTHEPYVTKEQRRVQYSSGKKIKWYLWFTNPRFYAVAAIYMCTRLINNIIQAYFPLYLIETLHLSKISVAIGPLIIFVTGFLTTLVLKVLNKVVGRYMVYFLGIACIWGGLIWFQLSEQPSTLAQTVATYCPAVLVGAGGATILVTSLSMVADLIGNVTDSSAFVYGLMSFTDKLSSGIVIQIIQLLHPCKNQICCPLCSAYYHRVLVLVPGSATAVAVAALAILVVLIYLKNRRQKTLTVNQQGVPINSPPRNGSPLYTVYNGDANDKSPLFPNKTL